MELIKKPFYFMRHGKTDWNVLRLALGQNEMALNTAGIQQAHNAYNYLKDTSIDVICHSPLKRAKQTAEILHQLLQCTLVEVEDLKEANFGAYEGKPIGDWIVQWSAGMLSDDIENLQTFSSRVVTSVNQALSYEGTVLIIGHGAFYWNLQNFLQVSEKYDIESCRPIFHKPSLSHNLWDITVLE